MWGRRVPCAPERCTGIFRWVSYLLVRARVFQWGCILITSSNSATYPSGVYQMLHISALDLTIAHVSSKKNKALEPSDGASEDHTGAFRYISKSILLWIEHHNLPKMHCFCNSSFQCLFECVDLEEDVRGSTQGLVESVGFSIPREKHRRAGICIL